MYESLKSILELLKDGKVEIDEAVELIEALYEAEKNERKNEISGNKKVGGKKKFLRIIVDSSEGDKVRINVPVDLLKYATAFIPNQVKGELNAQNIDLENILKLVEEGFEGDITTIESSNGDHIRIFVE